MNRGRGTASIVSSPALVGAVTVLVVIVAVFLAYNANRGLPFVPTYNLSAKLPTGADLVPGNEVRVGGFRVGVVDNVRPGRGVIDGHVENIAIADMKLDKAIQPLPADTRVVVRARSVLGLKYVQLTPGTSSKPFAAGDTIPLANACGETTTTSCPAQPVEFDDFLDTYDQQTRLNNQTAVVEVGDALAGRGESLNQAIEALNPFFRYLRPVATNLADPRTTIDQFFKQVGGTTSQIAPVAHTNAAVFTLMANTFQAIDGTEGQCPGPDGGSCLQQTIDNGPPAEAAGIASFQAQNPFLADFADLSRRLQPAAVALRTSLPALNSALAVGTPVSRQAVTLNKNTGVLFSALDSLAKDPDTLLSLQDLRDTLSVTKPLVNYVAPFQTVCNYADYFFTGLFGVHAEPTSAGTSQFVLVKPGDNANGQPNKWGAFAPRPVDIPSNMSAEAESPAGVPYESVHDPTFGLAIDSHGNADCQIGQYGYPSGPIPVSGVRGSYPPHASVPGDDSNLTQFENNFAGGSHTIYGNYNTLAGTTFTGVGSLKQVP